MEHQLNHSLLRELKIEGYTILYGHYQGSQDNCAYVPQKWDVEEFLESSNFNNYDQHAIELIDSLLKIEEEFLTNHSVILPERI